MRLHFCLVYPLILEYSQEELWWPWIKWYSYFRADVFPRSARKKISDSTTIKLFVHKTGVLKRVEKELKVRVPSWEMDLQRLKCLHPPSSLLSLIMLQIILKIILEIIWEIYWQIILFNLCWNQLWKHKKRIFKHRNQHPWICVFIYVAVSVTTFLHICVRKTWLVWVFCRWYVYTSVWCLPRLRELARAVWWRRPPIKEGEVNHAW